MKTHPSLLLHSLWIPLLIFHFAAAGGKKNISLVPLTGTSTTILINGNEREYYLLGHQNPIRLQVDGPGKLTIMSRLKIPGSSTGVQAYAVRVMEGKTTLKVQATQTDNSEAVFKETGDKAGKSRKFSMNVPVGSFTYEFWLDETPLEAGLKFSFSAERGLEKLVAIQPLSYDRIVTANINENLVAYYVASREHSVQLRIVGPTRVDISLRLNYDVKMKGEQKFSLIVMEGKELVTQRAMNTTKSTGLHYEEWKEVVPGKTIDIFVEVPKGEHTYQFALGESSANSLSLRFSVPKGDLSNEK